MIIGPVEKRFRRARVWFGELPRQLQSVEIMNGALPCRSSANSDLELPLAVEMKIDVTPSHMYGLLGGVFRPARSGQFAISVCVTNQKKDEFLGSIAPAIDRVHWMFPREFAEPTLNTILHQKQLPCGTLEINCAACAEIGSNAVIFACLAQVLTSSLSGGLSGSEILDFAFEQKTGGLLSQ